MGGRYHHSIRNAMLLAQEEPFRMRRLPEYIDTEHVLLGLLREPGKFAAEVVGSLGVDVATVLAEIEGRLAMRPESSVPAGRLPQTPRVIRAIEYAAAESEHLSHSVVRAGHLLLGLLNDEEALAFALLSTFRPVADFRRETLARLGFRIDPQWLAWNGGAAGKIARTIAEMLQWDQTPILADALEEAGCTNQDLLEHFRIPRGHGKSCSVLNVMGRRVRGTSQ